MLPSQRVQPAFPAESQSEPPPNVFLASLGASLLKGDAQSQAADRLLQRLPSWDQVQCAAQPATADRQPSPQPAASSFMPASQAAVSLPAPEGSAPVSLINGPSTQQNTDGGLRSPVSTPDLTLPSTPSSPAAARAPAAPQPQRASQLAPGQTSHASMQQPAAGPRNAATSPQPEPAAMQTSASAASPEQDAQTCTLSALPTAAREEGPVNSHVEEHIKLEASAGQLTAASDKVASSDAGELESEHRPGHDAQPRKGVKHAKQQLRDLLHSIMQAIQNSISYKDRCHFQVGRPGSSWLLG